MTTTAKEYKERYKNDDKRVTEYMGACIDAIVEKYGCVSPEFLISLDMLSYNLEVMFACLDDIKQNGVNKEDKQRGKVKSPSMATYFNTQTYIHKIIASFGFTPSSKSRIKINTDKQDAQKILDNIRNSND